MSPTMSDKPPDFSQRPPPLQVYIPIIVIILAIAGAFAYRLLH